MNSNVFNDIEIIRDLIEQQLNIDETLFQIEIVDNNENINPNNLVKDNLVQGVLKTSILSLGGANDGTEIKNISISLLVPLNVDNTKYNNSVTRTIKNLNGKSFELNDNISILFNSFNIIDNYKLNKPVNGVEYELVTIQLVATTSKYILRGEDEYIKVDGERLNGVFNIAYTNRKTTDGFVKGEKSLIQENLTNGIQIALEVDMFFYKYEDLHLKLLQELEENKTYTITYFNGYFTKIYKMILLSASTSSIVGDVKKGKLSFAIEKVE